jgi:RHS repeat-associated protein
VLLKQWIYRNALAPAAELDGSGNLVAQYVYGSKSNVPDYVRRGSATYRVMSDHLGSPRYVVNVADSGDVPFQASYSSVGEVTGTGLDWMPFGFAGGIYDGESGLVRFGFRTYDPTPGRWVAKEPLRFAVARNFYAYAFNDPVNWSDPTGLVPEPGGSGGANGEGGCEGAGGGPAGPPRPSAPPRKLTRTEKLFGAVMCRYAVAAACETACIAFVGRTGGGPGELNLCISACFYGGLMACIPDPDEPEPDSSGPCDPRDPHCA